MVTCLIDSVQLMDDNTQWMIASVRLVLDGSESPMEDAEGAGNRAEGAEEPVREESAATRSATQPLVAEVLLPHGGELVRAKVMGRKHASDGTPVGVAHSNPILDTREYEVSFPDGSTDCYAANMIAESLYSQVDADGRKFILMKEIMDHRLDRLVVPVDDAYYVDRNGRTT
jgi:hypothetical protein